MKVALAQINPTVGDFEGNAAKIRETAAEAGRRGADLAIFPELCLCGYPPFDLVERPAFVQRNLEELDRLAPEISLPSVVGLVGHAQDEVGKRLANCAALVGYGRVLFLQRKMLLPTYDVFDESRYFQPAHTQHAVEFCGVPLGITICEDIWNDKQFWARPLYERDPVAELVAKGAELIINISGSPFHAYKGDLRAKMLSSLALHHQRPVVYVNQVGGDDSLVFDGASCVYTGRGELAARAAAFAEDIVLYDTETQSGDVHAQPEEEIEAVHQALVLGARDYVRKCGFRRVIVGLSGGIDSAVVATLAAEAMGPANVLGVGMPGPYSSEGSIADARQLAENLGIEFQMLPITPIFEAYRTALAESFRGRPQDATEENIQARVRGNLLMALSNKYGALLLTTGNKSELAVGYCTLYGDMAGGLAVISDVPKTMVYALAEQLNATGGMLVGAGGPATGGRELIPQSSIKKVPSAELRPNQTDQDTLPPYEALDRILRDYVEEMMSPDEIAEKEKLPLKMVEEIALKVDRNEYKRQQAAMGLKITSKAFGIGRKFPVAQAFRAKSRARVPADS
ncbi:MAG TPA: NAD+ synthase [Candidatus Acidoferrales bacterium]|nr:NAD+ synthase [Candidatus Acidoferrales bacterium]